MIIRRGYDEYWRLCTVYVNGAVIQKVNRGPSSVLKTKQEVALADIRL